MKGKRIRCVDFFNLFDDVINELIKEHKLKIIDSLHIRCFFYNLSFRSRKSIGELENNKIIFNLDILEHSIYQCFEYMYQNFEIEINYHSILNKFRKKLEAQNIEENEEFYLINLTLDLLDTKSLDKNINFDKKIYKCTNHILKKFEISSSIPIELYLVLLYEVYLTYYQNKELYSKQTDLENIDMTLNIITQQYGSIQRKLNQNSDDYFLREEPPLKNDIVLVLQGIGFDSIDSLSLLCLNVGSDKWHKQFDKYDKKRKKDYYIFLL